MGKNCKRRTTILKTVFKLLDLESPKLLLKLARLIFAVSSLCLLVNLYSQKMYKMYIYMYYCESCVLRGFFINLQ